MTKPDESWLRSESHTKWARAMTICESPAASCGVNGHCAYGGRCFRDRDLERLAERVRTFLALGPGTPGHRLVWDLWEELKALKGIQA